MEVLPILTYSKKYYILVDYKTHPIDMFLLVGQKKDFVNLVHDTNSE